MSDEATDDKALAEKVNAAYDLVESLLQANIAATEAGRIEATVRLEWAKDALRGRRHEYERVVQNRMHDE